MFRRIHLLLILLCLAALMIGRPGSLPHAQAMVSAPGALEALSPFGALPDSCGGGLPTDGGQVCCVSGYVFLDGIPVEGAKVTITTNTTPPRSYVTTTKLDSDSQFPHYTVKLHEVLDVQPNDLLTIKAEYSSHERQIVYPNVLAGGQQVDIVLPRATKPDQTAMTEDYKYEQQLGRPGNPGALRLPAGVAVDGSGSIYVADSENARIQVFNSSGQFLRQWGTLGTKPGQLYKPTAIALDHRGNLYVTDGHLSRFSTAGAFDRSWGGRPDDPRAPFDTINGVAVDNNDTVYVILGGGAPAIWKLTAAGVWSEVLARDGVTPVTLSNPYGIAVDSAGNIFVADTSNHRVLKLSSAGQLQATWSKIDSGTSQPVAGTGEGEFNEPYGMNMDAVGNLYVADRFNHRIQKLDSASGLWSVVAGGEGNQNGKFAQPRALTFDASGAMYVADYGNNRIQKMLSGIWQQITPTGQSIPGQFYAPYGIALDGKGHIYITDRGNARVQKLDLAGVPVIAPWGQAGIGSGEFGAPNGVAVDSVGNVYVADAGNLRDRIQKFDSNGGFIKLWNGVGTAAGPLNQPNGIAIDTNATPNMVYVADTFNNRVVKFTSEGDFVWARNGGDIGIGLFNSPADVAVAPNGAVYISDSNNNRVVKLNADGALVAIWGGVGDPSRPINAPTGLSVDSAGNVYLSAVEGERRLHKYTSEGVKLAAWSTLGWDEGNTYGVMHDVDGEGRLYYADQQNNRIEVFRPMGGNQLPVATIVPVFPKSILPGTHVALRGLGGSDRTTTQQIGYEWLLDGATFSGADTANPIVTLNAFGTHELRLRVRDGLGVPSAWVAKTITLEAPIVKAGWTMLLYLDGDNQGTANDMRRALGELAEAIGRNPKATDVQVVALFDGPGSGGSTWYHQEGGAFTPDQRAEVNMGDPETLVEFVNWGRQQAPAEHYYLAIADHANGIDGIAWDDSTNPRDHLNNGELRNALARLTAGDAPIDVLHLDGCLMGLVENAYQMRGVAHYLVSSENLAWSAFAYASYREVIGPTTQPLDLARAVTERYQQAVASEPYTIAALDLDQIVPVSDQIKTLANELRHYAQVSQLNRDTLSALRVNVQKFDSDGDFKIEQTDEYVDLDHWAEQVSSISDGGVHTAATALRADLNRLVIAGAEHHGSGTINGNQVDLNNARGIAIYYPPKPTAKTYLRYTQGDLDFVSTSNWDTFLAAGLDPLTPDQTPPEEQPIAPLSLLSRVYLALVRR